MIAGSDRRHGDKKLGLKPRSDTIILARIDPGKGVALLSLPRDLKVEIPGHGTDKLNVAYTLGGPKLSIKTVKNLTGLAINHYVDVSFHGFAEGVNALGCVYVDIDRRYFNNNAGLGFGQNYAVINVKPGYQKMCGQRALEYVRYRHTDNDIVRGARQQDFLRQVRSQVSAQEALRQRRQADRRIRRQHPLRYPVERSLRRLLQVMLGVQDKPIKQVKFHGRLGESYVTASPAQIKAATRQFLYLRPAKGPLNKKRKRSKTARKGRSGGANANLVDFTVTSRGQGQIATDRVGFPVYYPRKLVKGSSYAEDAPRTYTITATERQATQRLQDGRVHRLHRRVLRPAGHVLARPADPRAPVRDARRSGAGSTCSSTTAIGCGWLAGRPTRGSYWISNTLLQTLSAKEMLGVARTLVRAR